MATINLNAPLPRKQWKPLYCFQYNLIQVAIWQGNAPYIVCTAGRYYFQEYTVQRDHENIHIHTHILSCTATRHFENAISVNLIACMFTFQKDTQSSFLPNLTIFKQRLWNGKNNSTPQCWALLEKPPVAQLLINFPTFYGTRRFITVFTRALHWSIS
jgi:hypothetical protein